MRSDKPLEGKVAWITGGGSGFGLAGAIALARAGAHVIVSGRSVETLKKAEKELKSAGSAESIALDVSEQREVSRAAGEIQKRHGRIDILINSAGMNLPKRNFRNVSVDGWNQIVATNLSGTFYCCQAVLPGMRERKDGLIVNISSWAGRYASPLFGPGYYATKTAVRALTEQLNIEECAHGVRATAILPGEAATPILEKRPVPPSAEERARMLQAEDVANAIYYVATQPKRVCINELMITPTHNRFIIGGFEQAPS